MTTPNFGATYSDVLTLLPGTAVGDFDAAGDASTPAGQAEITAELNRQERAMRSRMRPDLVAKVNATSAGIPALADCCARCAAARLGLRTEGVDGNNPPLHIAQLSADCDADMKSLQAGTFIPPGLGTNDPPPVPKAGSIILSRA